MENSQQLITNLESSIDEYSAKLEIQKSQAAQIEEAHTRLCDAGFLCADIRKQSSQLKQKAFYLIDQHGIIIEQIRIIADILETFNDGAGVRMQDWNRLRLSAMQAISKLIEQVQRNNLLDAKDLAPSSSRTKKAVDSVVQMLESKKSESVVVVMAVQEGLVFDEFQEL